MAARVETFMAVAAVSVLAEQHTRPERVPWYPWALTALAAGSSIVLNFGHPYIPLDPPPRWLVAAVYGVPPICAPFAWHPSLTAHRPSPPPAHPGGLRARPADAAVPNSTGPRAGQDARAPVPIPASTPQAGESARAVVRGLLPHEPQDALVSSQDVCARTGLSRSRAYALLREERACLVHANGHARAGTFKKVP